MIQSLVTTDFMLKTWIEYRYRYVCLGDSMYSIVYDWVECSMFRLIGDMGRNVTHFHLLSCSRNIVDTHSDCAYLLVFFSLIHFFSKIRCALRFVILYRVLHQYSHETNEIIIKLHSAYTFSSVRKTFCTTIRVSTIHFHTIISVCCSSMWGKFQG